MPRTKFLHEHEPLPTQKMFDASFSARTHVALQHHNSGDTRKFEKEVLYSRLNGFQSRLEDY